MLPRVRKLSATVLQYIRPAPYDMSIGIFGAGFYYRHFDGSDIVHSLRSKKIYLEIRNYDHPYRVFCAYIRVLPKKCIFVPYCRHKNTCPLKYRKLNMLGSWPQYIIRHRRIYLV